MLNYRAIGQYMLIHFSTLFDFYIDKPTSLIRDFKNPFVLLFFHTFSAISWYVSPSRRVSLSGRIAVWGRLWLIQLEKQCAWIDFLISSASHLAMTWVHNHWVNHRSKSPKSSCLPFDLVDPMCWSGVLLFKKKNSLALSASRWRSNLNLLPTFSQLWHCGVGQQA